LIAGSAAAVPGPGVLPGGTAIFSSFVTNNFNGNNVALHSPIAGTQGGSPVAQEFTVPVPTFLGSLTFELADPTPSDGGSILVYLVPNGTANLPSASGITLTGATLLGSILDSSLSSTPSEITISGDNARVAAGTDWIALVSTSTTTGAAWERAIDTIGLDVGNNASNTDAGLYNAHTLAPGGTTLTSVNNNSLEMQIDAPEPASLALLGAGVMGLGFVRRRMSKKSAG
jgi:PEP-CTERM motif